jgi:hypothetical protein
MTAMTRGLQGIVLIAVACALSLSMGACPSIDPAIDPIINPNPADQVANPVFDPAAGSFQDTLNVAISCATPGAAIRYSLDGTVPTESNGTVYTSSITLAQTTTVRAVAFHDNLGSSDLVTATYTRLVGSSLTISSPIAACALVQGQSGTIDVNCMVTATLCEVQSVTVDLSTIGGAAVQPLNRFGNYWFWFGVTTPPTAGTRTITFTATDTSGATTTAAVTTVVSPASVTNAAPAITAATAAGQLVRNQAGTVTVSCTATDADGTVESVRADLSTIGGSSAQYLALSSGTWAWTGTVTPPLADECTITFTAFDNQGASGSASATILVAAPNGEPSITSVNVPASLVWNQSNAVTVSCTATDSDGTVQSVTADLSAIGGLASQALSCSGNAWQWSGSVTPTVVGQRTITLTAADDDGSATTISRTIQVTAPNQPPTIGDPQVAGILFEGTKGAVTVSCIAADPDVGLASVRADLTAIGGSSTQSLALSAGRYTWTGEVTPLARGSRTITFTAVDTQAATASTTTTIEVAAPNAAPSVTNASATGDVVLNQSCSVTVACDAADSDGTVQSVTANLTAIGGSSAQTLLLDGGHWTWTGSVTPATTGARTVTFTATDDAGQTGSASTTITVFGSQPGSIVGTSVGNVTYTPALILSGSPNPMTPFVKASAMTFSAGFQPESLPVYFGSAGPLVVSLPATGLLNPGDQSTAIATVSGSPATITGTVVQVARSATAFSIDLNLQIVLASGTLAGPYHWEAGLLSDNELSWSETTLLDVGGSGMILRIDSAGTLTRQ